MRMFALRCVAVKGRVFKGLGFAVLAAGLVLSHVSPAEARRKKSSYAPPYAAKVVDVKTGARFMRRMRMHPVHPASITKVNDALYGVRAIGTWPSPAGFSIARFGQCCPAGAFQDRVRCRRYDRGRGCDQALVTKSANDVAVTVAENLGGSEEDFAESMTARHARSA